jgi:hypothetical protein
MLFFIIYSYSFLFVVFDFSQNVTHRCRGILWDDRLPIPEQSNPWLWRLPPVTL